MIDKMPADNTKVLVVSLAQTMKTLLNETDLVRTTGLITQ